MRSRFTLGLLMALSLCRADDFRANDYGAKGDGKTLDTAAIQKAIDAAAEHSGTVIFRPGTYLSGSLFLKSKTRLRLAEGVEIGGVQDLAGYPIMATRVAGIEMKWPAALINVYQQSDVRISGKGIIDGNGKIFWDRYWTMRRNEYEPKGLRWAVDYDCPRPRLIQIYKSSGVEIQDLTLKRSGFWTVHICYSRNVSVDDVIIRNNIGGRGPSTDGVDVDSSSDVRVANCDIECNDDAICLKAGRDADGLRVNRPTENVVIHDNTVRAGAAGVTFGSETSGGIHDVEAYRIHVLPSVANGVLFKSASTRGGTMERIKIHDMEIKGVRVVIGVSFNWNPTFSYAKIPDGMTDVPDYWRVLAEPVPPAKGLPHLRDVRISSLTATDSHRAFLVDSYKHSPLQDVNFTNLDIQAATAGSIENAENWHFVNTKIRTSDGRKVICKDCRNVVGLP